jgi:phenylacetate-CoA ligase
MTSRAEERRAQAAWTARLRRPAPLYDWFLEREFESDDQRRARTEQALAKILRFSAANVPHYRRLFREIGIDPDDPKIAEALPSLPILRKLDLRDNDSAFQAERLPDDDRMGTAGKSSGTTGMPLSVLHTTRSNRMFSLLKQREYRWFRFDPAGMLALIRSPWTLQPKEDGSRLSNHETYRMNAWPYVGQDFSTGPMIALSLLNSPEDQIAWLRSTTPDHLLVATAALEHLALVAGDRRPCESLKGVVGIAEQLTAAMRDFVERRFGCPIHQNYGLNELGLVAVRCDAGRYHIHSEHCLVEIVRSDGSTAAPGETGHVIVTGLSNMAMPLLRYDADDHAVVAKGPCACGRTLPSFADIVGRYTRFAHGPEQSRALFEGIRAAILRMPPDVIRDLRQFQIYQDRDGRYELRLLVRAALPDKFAELAHAAWSTMAKPPVPALSLNYVDAIERGPSGKYQVFLSEFAPSLDAG